MKARILLVVVFPMFAFSVFAQTITPQVINSSGGSFQKGYHIVDWSIGELALVNHMFSTDYIVTNGFIQPFTHEPNLFENNYSFGEGEIRILPNPTRDVLEIDFRTKQQGKVSIILVDVLGKTLYKREVTSHGHGQIEKINMTKYAHGSYFLQINLNPFIGFTRKTGAYKIIKPR
jgi:Secretion system C-terminal sorting domain